MSEWPVYFKERLLIDNLDSNVGVITLWQPKEVVASALSEGSYCACGQLYTKRGINYLLRNVLANPKIRYLVMCGVDRQGSGAALLKFFKSGVVPADASSGSLCGWEVQGDSEARLDKELSFEVLETLRANVQVFDLRTKPLSEIRGFVNSLKPLPSFGAPQYFDEPAKVAQQRYPADMSVFKVRRDYIGDAWLDALKIVNKFGFEVPGLYGAVKGVHNLSIVIEKEDPNEPKLYNFLKFGAEGLRLYTAGFFDSTGSSNDTYTYGERLFTWDGIDQVQIMIDKLKRFPQDRGALAVLWKPHCDNFPPKGTAVNKGGITQKWRVPCLVMVLGQCFDDVFNMTSVFRNNDVYGAWPLNAFALRMLQHRIAKAIDKNLGTLTTIAHIAEVYEVDFVDLNSIISENDSLDRTCVYEPRGYFIVDVLDTDIVLSFYSKDGSLLLKEFKMDGRKHKVARDLCALVMQEMLISEVGAACDLGRQLAKAETAIKLGLKFEQDRPLRF